MPSLHDLLWWLLAIGIVVAAVQLLWIAITPVSPLGDWKPNRVRLMQEGARSALMTGFDPFNRNVAITASNSGSAAVVTDLPLTLYGIRVNPVSGGGTAIIAGSDGDQQLYRIGDEVMPGVTLSAVAFDHVTLGRNGGSELLYLDQSKPAPMISPEKLNSGGPSLPAAGDNLSAASLREGISFGSASPDGGVALNPGGDGSVFRKAGLRAGDVLVAVNGEAVAAQGDLAKLAGQIRPGSNLSMTVRRGERDVPLNITVSQ